MVSNTASPSERAGDQRRKRAGAERGEDGVKVKAKRTAPTNTSLLPPCKVCQEPAAGFHYGANTCEACKGFFRRSLLRKEAYRCIGKGSCNIRVGKRKICPKCRHQKCLEAGMSVEAIKTGRYTHAKRTQDILEYRMSMAALHPNPSLGPAPIAMETCKLEPLSATESLQLQRSVQVAVEQCDSTTSVPDVDFDPTPIVTPALEGWVPLSPVSLVGSVSDGGGMLGGCVSPLSSPPTLPAPSSALSPLSASSSLSPLSSPTSLLTPSSAPPFPPLSSLHSSSSVFPSSSPTTTTPLTPSQSSAAALSKAPSVPSPKAGPDPDSVQTVLDDAECERLVNHLLTSNQRLVAMLADSLTPQEILDKQKACSDSCKLRVEVFGSMRLSHDEYQEIYETTGLDIDGRQMMVDKLVALLDESIRRFIAFIKVVPGLDQLSLKDQIKLIKDNRCEFRMLSSAFGYNCELQVLTMPSGRTECIHDLAKIIDHGHIAKRFECAHVVQSLGLNKDELVVLKTLMVLTVGNEDVDEPEKISELQWRYAQCLCWLFRKNGRNVNREFARAMTGLCRIRELCLDFYTWLKSRPFEHYSQFEDNALLAEWFSNS